MEDVVSGWEAGTVRRRTRDSDERAEDGWTPSIDASALAEANADRVRSLTAFSIETIRNPAARLLALINAWNEEQHERSAA